MRVVDMKSCPNGCEGALGALSVYFNREGARVVCSRCRMCGPVVARNAPVGNHFEAAAELWNRLPRRARAVKLERDLIANGKSVTREQGRCPECDWVGPINKPCGNPDCPAPKPYE